MSRYISFEELRLDNWQGYDYDVFVLDRGSPLVLIAPHGGGIEPGTTEIVLAMAGNQYSCYIFNGIRAQNNHMLHLASTNFDEPQCNELIDHAQMVLAVHGCSGMDDTIYIGGLHTHFKKFLFYRLRNIGFNVQIDGNRHAGSHPRNICNRGSSGRGIQLEISLGLRRQMFNELSRTGREEVTPVFDQLISTVQEAIDEYLRLTDVTVKD